MDFEKTGSIANAMSSKAPKMTLASYIALLNVKANHRKTVVTDKEALVSSGIRITQAVFMAMLH